MRLFNGPRFNKICLYANWELRVFEKDEKSAKTTIINYEIIAKCLTSPTDVNVKSYKKPLKCLKERRKGREQKKNIGDEGQILIFITNTRTS